MSASIATTDPTAVWFSSASNIALEVNSGLLSLASTTLIVIDLSVVFSPSDAVNINVKLVFTS